MQLCVFLDIIAKYYHFFSICKMLSYAQNYKLYCQIIDIYLLCYIIHESHNPKHIKTQVCFTYKHQIVPISKYM